MENGMCETNDASTVAAFDDQDTHADRELDAVTGGAFPIVMAQMALAANRVDISSLSIVKYLD
jgi:hypothetical protein